MKSHKRDNINWYPCRQIPSPIGNDMAKMGHRTTYPYTDNTILRTINRFVQNKLFHIKNRNLKFPKPTFFRRICYYPPKNSNIASTPSNPNHGHLKTRSQIRPNKTRDKTSKACTSQTEPDLLNLRSSETHSSCDIMCVCATNPYPSCTWTQGINQRDD